MEDKDWAEIFRWGPLPVNNSWHGAENIHKSLMHSATHHAYLALSSFSKDDGNIMADAGLHAGLAIEHLAKCYLATIHPILLIGKTCDIDAMLHFVGKSELAKTSPYRIKTVSGEEACNRIKRFLPEFRYNEQADALLFHTRNCASHLGLANETRDAVRLMIRLADPLLDALGYDQQRFWGLYHSVVNTLRDETVSEQRAMLDVKLESARRELERRMRGLEPAQQAAFKALITARRPYHADYIEPHECPVCQSHGWLLCHREYDVIEDETQPDGEAFIFNEPIAYPMSFHCEVCGLELDETDIVTLGMPTQIDLPESEIGKPAL